MTQADHILRIAAWFISHMSRKYEKGQVQHGGRLWRKNTLHMLRDEIIDLPVYFEVLEQNHEEAKHCLKVAIDYMVDEKTIGDESVIQAYNLLEYGNTEGEQEEDH